MKAASIALLSGLAIAGSAYGLVQTYDWGDDKDAWAKDAEFADTKAICRQVKTTPLSRRRPAPAGARRSSLPDTAKADVLKPRRDATPKPSITGSG